jgi:hypothetical protein
MISMDKYIIEFVSGNTITLYVALTFLKGIALATKNVEDDKIVTLISNLIDSIKLRYKNKNDIELKNEKLSEIKT